MVRSRISSKEAKLSGPAKKAAMSELFSRVTPGVMSIRASLPTRPGWARARAIEVAPPSDIPTTMRAVGARVPITTATSVGHDPGTQHGIVAGPVGVPVSGQVDRHQGPVEGQGHRVPGVGVLPPTVDEHHLGRVGAPHQGTDPPARGHLHELATNGGRPAPRQSHLAGVLPEQRELVVVADRRRRSCPPLPGLGRPVGPAPPPSPPRSRRPPGRECRSPPGPPARRSGPRCRRPPPWATPRQPGPRAWCRRWWPASPPTGPTWTAG